MRVLFAGLGGVGQRHLRNLKQLVGDDLEVVAWRTRRHDGVLNDQLKLASEAGLEETFGIRVVSTLEEGIASRPDAVFVCNPTSAHLEVARAAVAARCALFVEKPLAASLEGVEDLVAQAERANVTTFVGYQLRFHPLLQRVKTLLGERTVGRVLAARLQMGDYLPNWHTYEDYRQMYTARADLGGGVILSQIHDLDLIGWWFGPASQVFAVAGHWTALEIDVEDVASMLFQCEDEGRPLPVHVQQDFIQRPASRTIEILGETGKIVVDLPGAELRLIRNNEADVVESLSSFQRNDIFLAELRHFVACVRGTERSQIPLASGMASLKMALAARRSARTGTAVQIESRGEIA